MPQRTAARKRSSGNRDQQHLKPRRKPFVAPDRPLVSAAFFAVLFGVVSMSKAMTTLVVGPTCSGKSTFIERNCSETGVIYGFEIPNREIPASGSIHYNMLFLARSDPAMARDRTPEWDLLNEPNFAKVLASRRVRKAIVIVAPISELKRRANERVYIEPTRTSLGHYPNKAWLEILSRVDVAVMYERLFAVLRDADIPFELVYSSATFGIAGDPVFLPTDPAFLHHNLAGCYCPLGCAAEAAAFAPIGC